MAEGTDWLDFEKRLAKAILEAQKIREDSYDHKVANEYQHKAQNWFYSQFYTKSMQAAADEAAGNEGFDTRMGQPIYLLNEYCWNDIQDWAKDILESKKDEERKNDGKETTRTV